MTASYRRAANDVGEGTDFRLVSLRILPGPHRHKTPQPSTAAAQPLGPLLLADDFKPSRAQAGPPGGERGGLRPPMVASFLRSMA
jgi:hypothetical protein